MSGNMLLLFGHSYRNETDPRLAGRTVEVGHGEQSADRNDLLLGVKKIVDVVRLGGFPAADGTHGKTGEEKQGKGSRDGGGVPTPKAAQEKP